MLPSAVDRIDAEEVVALARRLVQFNTVNPPGNEEAAMQFLGGYLADAGVAIEYQPAALGRGNLVARLRGSGETGHLVLSGHMDTVPPGETAWERDPFAADLADGRLYGRGSADMKGGVAAMAVAMATLARAGFRPRADLILAVSCDEEAGAGLGARHLAGSGVLAGSAYLVVGEFSGLDVYVGHKGGCIMRITAHGKAAHSAMPHLGVNAIAFMAHVITALQANPFPFTPHDVLGEPTVSVTVISGGEKRNMIPERCTITVGVRTVPGQTRQEIVAQTQRLLDDIAARTGLAVRTEVESLGAEPVVTPRDHPLVQAMVEVAAAVRGVAPVVTGVSYGTDALILAPAYGLATVIFGPGHFAQAHQIDEYVEVSEIVQAARAYTLIAERLLG